MINMDTHIHHHPEQLEIKVVRRFWSRPWIKISFIFFLGLFAGLLLFGIFRIGSNEIKVPDLEMKGFFFDSLSFNNLKVADELQYTSPLTKAVCKVRCSARIVEIQVNLSSLYPVKSTIEFDLNNFEILNIMQISVNDQSTTMATANFVQINSIGDNKYIIHLNNKNNLPHHIDFKVYQNDALIYQNSVKVNKE